MRLPASLLSKLPKAVAVTVSLPTKPLSVPTVMAASVVPSYTLPAAVEPATVSALGVMLAVVEPDAVYPLMAHAELLLETP